MATVKPTAALSLTYVTANRATRSDVVAATTSLLPLPKAVLAASGVSGESDRGEEAAKTKRKSVASKPRGPGPLSLSVPAAKLNRELTVERKLFLDRLHHERRLRAELEQSAATDAQAVVRGFLVRTRSLRSRDESPTRPPRRQASSTQRKPDALIRRQLGQLYRLTDRAAGVSAVKRARSSGAAFAKKMSAPRVQGIVVRLQCFVRRYLARKTVRVLQAYQREEREREAVVVIQARLRAHFDRKQLASQEKAARDAAATKIQSYVRRRLDQKFIGLMRFHLRAACQEAEAALKLQKVLRAKIARQRVIQERMERASLVVQASYRGHVTKTSFDALRRERVESVAKLQATFRGHSFRKKRASTVAAAQRIQALQRGRSTRRSVAQSSQAATKLQSLYRGATTRRRTKWRASEAGSSALEIRRQKLEAEILGTAGRSGKGVDGAAGPGPSGKGVDGAAGPGPSS